MKGIEVGNVLIYKKGVIYAEILVIGFSLHTFDTLLKEFYFNISSMVKKEFKLYNLEDVCFLMDYLSDNMSIERLYNSIKKRSIVGTRKDKAFMKDIFYLDDLDQNTDFYEYKGHENFNVTKQLLFMSEEDIDKFNKLNSVLNICNEKVIKETFNSSNFDLLLDKLNKTKEDIKGYYNDILVNDLRVLGISSRFLYDKKKKVWYFGLIDKLENKNNETIFKYTYKGKTLIDLVYSLNYYRYFIRDTQGQVLVSEDCFLCDFATIDI